MEKIVYKYSIARKLIHMGFRVVDIKPQIDKSGKMDFTRCNFLFEDVDGLQESINNFATKNT